MNAKLLYFFFFDGFYCSYRINTAELDASPNAVAVIFEAYCPCDAGRPLTEKIAQHFPV